MHLFAEIAFPTANRQNFTYRIPDKVPVGDAFLAADADAPSKNTPKTIQKEEIQPGMRVWVPLKNQMSIGMVVSVHENRPAFETRKIACVLDLKPVLKE
ncbi:hypothetical protein QLX67_11975, partial [Balneolaceae bacterium ANBcel3]|nr:hypothetical protein [Balneolaceae bacterium ANBcel3]